MRSLALLRGVNVGGARAIKMSDLAAIFRDLGAQRVETVIQSGNVVFEADRPAETCAAASAAIEARLGFRPPMVCRSAAGWRAMTEANPFLAAGVPAETLHVACLADAPRAGASLLDPQRYLPDTFAVAGADVYLHLPNGVAGAKLSTAILDRAFGTVSTLRNWRSAIRLLERLEA